MGEKLDEPDNVSLPESVADPETFEARTNIDNMAKKSSLGSIGKLFGRKKTNKESTGKNSLVKFYQSLLKKIKSIRKCSKDNSCDSNQIEKNVDTMLDQVGNVVEKLDEPDNVSLPESVADPESFEARINEIDNTAKKSSWGSIGKLFRRKKTNKESTGKKSLVKFFKSLFNNIASIRK